MAKKKEIKFICGCGFNAKCVQGLSIHKNRRDHWIYPKPEVPKFRSYMSLVEDGNWGSEMTEEEIKHPTKDRLMLGYLALIAKKLDEIEVELKRTKIIK